MVAEEDLAAELVVPARPIGGREAGAKVRDALNAGLRTPVALVPGAGAFLVPPSAVDFATFKVLTDRVMVRPAAALCEAVEGRDVSGKLDEDAWLEMEAMELLAELSPELLSSMRDFLPDS